jgi:hypothetical protein
MNSMGRILDTGILLPPSNIIGVERKNWDFLALSYGFVFSVRTSIDLEHMFVQQPSL